LNPRKIGMFRVVCVFLCVKKYPQTKKKAKIVRKKKYHKRYYFHITFAEILLIGGALTAD